MIHHVAVEVRHDDVDACVAFWALLGFGEVLPPDTLRHRARWVEREGTQIHLLWTDEPVVPPSGHVAVVAGDYDAVQTALRDAGLEVEERTQHWGEPRCVVVDPSGHRVEIMAAAPAG